jgi:hypothetical protein
VFELATAGYCQNKRSYISANVAKRYNIRPDRTKDHSVRLTWRKHDPAKEDPKSKSTRFWFQEGERIVNDIAFGTEWDKLDEDEEKLCEVRDDINNHISNNDASDCEENCDTAEDNDTESNSGEESSDEEGCSDDREDSEVEDYCNSEDSYVEVAMTNQAARSSQGMLIYLLCLDGLGMLIPAFAAKLIRPDVLSRISTESRGNKAVAGILVEMKKALDQTVEDPTEVAILEHKRLHLPLSKTRHAEKMATSTKKINSAKRTNTPMSRDSIPQEPEIQKTKRKNTSKVLISGSRQRNGQHSSLPLKVKTLVIRKEKDDL